jgi:hypothetical protein
MKRITLLFLCLWAVSSQAQTLVNQELFDTLSHPTQRYGYIKVLPDGAGNYVLLYNILYTGGEKENYQLIKINSSGVPVASYGFNSLHNGSDFGTNLYIKGNYAYSCGFTIDSPLGTHRINAVKLDMSRWDTVWTISESIDSITASQAPFSILVDDSESVYIAGTVQTPTSYKMTAVKYDVNGIRQWVTSYDTTGYTTVGAAMTINGDNYLAVTGSRFDNLGHSDFVTAYLDPASGSYAGLKIEPNGTGTISHPIAIVTDMDGNNYIAGTSTVSGLASVVKLVKYDSLYNKQWAVTWGDSTQTQIAAAMSSDFWGNNFIAGTKLNANGTSDLFVVAFGADGSVLGTASVPSTKPNEGYVAKDITQDDFGGFYVTGYKYTGTDSDLVTIAFDDQAHIKWMKTFNRCSGCQESAYNVGLSDDGTTILVSGKSEGSDSLYFIMKYEQYTKTNTLTSNGLGGQYMANQLIIRFDKSVVRTAAVDKTDIEFADPYTFLTNDGYTALQSKLPFELGMCKFERIYKGLKSTYTHSIARNGDTIPIPDFWAAFLLIHPSADASETTIADSINTLFPMVVHTNLNYVGTLQCNPQSTNDNDPNYPYQKGLNLDTIDFGNDSAHINLDSAWCLETGKKFIKVGVYDLGLYGGHEDFSAISPGAFNLNKVQGYDFYNRVTLESEPFNSDYPGASHGTWVSGVIGATRNNGLGVSGIAGGDASIDSNDIGVKLFGMMVITPGLVSGNSITLPISDLVNAYVVGCTYTPDSAYGYGLHIVNNSYGVVVDSQQTSIKTPADLREFESSFKYMYRNQTTAVAAAGNYPTDIIYPANFYKDWIICVSGSNNVGSHQQHNQLVLHAGDTDWDAFYGPAVDLIAPSTLGLISTTDFHGAVSNHDYTNAFRKTSAATPHVTGTGALLLSYLDSSAPTPKNLSPEDIDHLLSRNAVDVETPGRDIYSGWGRLNAGRALQDVNKSCKEVKHLGKDGNPNSSSILIKIWEPIKLTEKYTSPSGITYDTVSYLTWVYKSISTVSNNLAPHQKIIDAWTRPSSTQLLSIYDSTSHELSPHEMLYIDSINNTRTVISGCYYLIFNPADSSFIGAWGAQDSTQNSFYSRFDYTLLLKDTINNCTSFPAGIKEVNSHTKLKFKPNPTSGSAELSIFTDKESRVSLNFVDIEGRIVATIPEYNISSGTTIKSIDVSELATGIYFLNIQIGDTRDVIKFLKIEY